MSDINQTVIRRFPKRIVNVGSVDFGNPPNRRRELSLLAVGTEDYLNNFP